MSQKPIGRRFLALLLLVSMLLGIVPLPAAATEALPEEKPTVKATGTDYTNIIDTLDEPAGIYTTHYDCSNLTSTYGELIGLGNYIMFMTVAGKSYAFNPMSITGTSTTIGCLPVTLGENDYLEFQNETDVYDATLTFRANILAQYHYERLLVRRDGKAIEPYGVNKVASFRLVAGSNETVYFQNVIGADGMMLYKNVVGVGDATGKTKHFVYFQNNKFALGLPENCPRGENTVFYFYEVHDLTNALYTAIKKARDYATGNPNGVYDAGLYAGFEACLEDAIALYNTYNHCLTEEESKTKFTIQEALDTRAAALEDYIEVLSAANLTTAVSKLSSPIGWRNSLVSFADHTDRLSFEGTYFVAGKNSSGNTYFMKPTQVTNGHLPAIKAQLRENSIANSSIEQAVDLIYEPKEDGSLSKIYYFRNQNGQYLRGEVTNGTPGISLGHAHVGFGLVDSNNHDGTAIYRNITTNPDGTSNGTNICQLTLGTDFYFQNKPQSNWDCFLQFYRLTWSTDELHSAITHMVTRTANNGNGVLPAVYRDFLNCLEESIALYLKYNVSFTEEQLEQTTHIQEELKAQTVRLLSYKYILAADYSQILKNLPTPYNELYVGPLSIYHSLNIAQIAGNTCYIVHPDPTDNTGSKGWAMVPDNRLYLNGYMGAEEVEIRDGRVINGIPFWAFALGENPGYKEEFKPFPIYNTNFNVDPEKLFDGDTNANRIYAALGYRSQRGFAVRVHDDGFVLYTKQDFDKDNKSTPYHFTYRSDADFNGFPLQAHNGLGPNDSKSNLLQLYCITDTVLDLYAAIARMAVYVEGNTADRYPEEEYSAFLACLQKSIELYQYYNTPYTSRDRVQKKAELDAQAETLLSYVDKLTLSDTTTQYIDIPMEILDFRADGLMFEYGDEVYGLGNTSGLESKLNLPAGFLQAGKFQWPTYTKPDETIVKNRVTTELTVDTLIDGNLVYTSAALKPIAYSIASGCYETNDNIPGQNTALQQKVREIASRATTDMNSNAWDNALGSAEDTFKNTTTGENGGDLPWDQVTTAYDLAYYIANYMWRPVPSGDTPEDGYPYNLLVPERSFMRLYREENGKYTIDAENWVETTGYHIYNAIPVTATTTHHAGPNFMPIDDLGFEERDYIPGNPDTDRSSYHETNWNVTDSHSNFHYTVHAYGSFVYYEEQDLYFDFLGDDDVYFYINDRLAMDLGGGHATAGNSLYLNSVADKLGLVDGGVYSFDMFYAERKTTGSNLRFSTNMKVFHTDTQTVQNQYAVQINGESTVDPLTGKGNPLSDNSTVRVGDVIAYSFDMTNTREVPVFDLEFENTSLGVSLSKDSITTYTGTLEDGTRAISLTNPDESHANGVVTPISDLILEYCALDAGGVPLTETVTHVTVDEMVSLLTAANQFHEASQSYIFTNLAEGRYRVQLNTTKDLKDLLEAGLPKKSSISIYGFLRKTGTKDLPFENTLTSACTYPTTPKENAERIPIHGIANRLIRVLEHSSMPQVRELEIVLDYGKAVTIPLEDISDLIRFEDGSPVEIGSVAGFIYGDAYSYNGRLLKKLPNDIFCDAPGENAPATQGTYTVDATGLTYKPTQFLTQQEILYGVVEVEYFYYGTETTEEFRYILVELRLTPATSVYYETDFASGIFSLKQVGGGQNWKVSSDGTSSDDSNQDYNRLAGTVYGTEIDREYISSNGFFADFTGDGYEKRYRDTPLYNGYDFDLTGTVNGTDHAKYWTVNVANSGYATIDHAKGTLSFTMKPEKQSVYVQTGTGSDIEENKPTSTPLKLYPAEENIAQVRFKLKNFRQANEKKPPQVRLYFSGADGNLKYEWVKFPEAYLNNDQYYTATIPLTETYSNIPVVDRLRVQLWDVISQSEGEPGIMTIDYIYVGPAAGLPEHLYQNYLLFTFDASTADTLRYSSAVYGSTNFSNVGNWSTDIASSPGSKLEIKNGCLTFTDNIAENNNADYTYNYFHSGSSDTLAPLTYKPGNQDVCQIRVRITNGYAISGKTPDVWLEAYPKGANARDSFRCGMVTFDLLEVKGKFYTFTIPLNESKYLNLSSAFAIRPAFHNIQGATFEVDYVYIGPEYMLTRLNRDQASNTSAPAEAPHDHLFFDFTNKDRDLLRYSNLVYNNPACNDPECTVANCQNQDHLLNGSNYDLVGNWSVDFDTRITGIDTAAGTITFVDKDNTAEYNYIHSAPKFWLSQLNFTPGTKDHLLVRMKITGGSCLSDTLTLSMEYFEGPVKKTYGKAAFPASDYMDGNYHIFTVPLNMEDYLKTPLIKAVRPVISGTQGCTFTIDYIYVGPLTKAEPRSHGLYFGFGNTEEDQLRYISEAYGYTNYDSNQWALAGSDAENYSIASTHSWLPSACTLDMMPEQGCVAVTMTNDTNDWLCMYTQDTLKFHIAEDDIIQVRVKVENATGTNGKHMLSLYYTDAKGGKKNVVTFVKVNTEEAIAQGWCIYSARLKDLTPTNSDSSVTPQSIWQIDSVKTIGLSCNNATPKDMSKPFLFVDYIYIGPGKIAPEPVYGYDSSYEDDTMLSNGSSYVVEGQGVKTASNTAKYTEGSFDFRGTGFDIISRTGVDQATIRLEVTDQKTGKVVKTLTVNNKGASELYQIPIVSVQGLDYGDYTVTFWVNAAVINSPLEFLNRGGQFHFDAVRIYDPMGKNEQLLPELLSTYCTDKEAYAHRKEIRNILLSPSEYASLAGAGTGSLFVDMASEPKETVPVTDASGTPVTDASGNPITTEYSPEGIELVGPYTAKLEVYDKAGPKNEVYLAPGQAVAFALKISTTHLPTSVDVGAKAIRAGDSPTLVAGIVTKGTDAQGLLKIASRREVPIHSATAQYYSLPIDKTAFFKEKGSRYCYIVLHNPGTAGTLTNVLSVTDLKITYDTAPEVGLPQDAWEDSEVSDPAADWNSGKRSAEAYFDFIVDSRTLEAAALVMKATLETPILVEGTNLMHSLNLASDISINYAVTQDSMADYDRFYLEVRIPGKDEALRIDPVPKGDLYYFTLEGLTAVQMSDTIEATLHMEKDGRFYYSETDLYSISQYARAQLNKTGIDPKLKALCADLLRYGSAAQVYKSYRTYLLPIYYLTEEHKTYMTDLDSLSFGSNNRQLGDLSDPTAKWVGKSLILDSKVTVRYVVDLTGCNDPETVSLRVRYTDHKGTEQTVILTDPQPYGTNENYYSFDLNSLLAAELRTLLHAAVYMGETQISNTLEYSVDTYGANKTGTLGTLCKALIAYSDSAKAYFATN